MPAFHTSTMARVIHRGSHLEAHWLMPGPERLAVDYIEFSATDLGAT